ncbi:MAG: hypothetical protein PHG69_01215 [Candidatus Omnitrophica bacterium]|nr:hypothetical protein [Candidatus Omnitrophota bacterium]
MKINRKSVCLFILISLLIGSFYLTYDPFRVINPVKTAYLKEPNKVKDIPNRAVFNLDNWNNHHFYNCNKEQTPGYLLYNFTGKTILGAHIYSSFACSQGDEYTISYSLDNKDYRIIEPVRRVQSAYEYILDFRNTPGKASSLWLKTTLLGRKSWCNLVNYSVEVYSSNIDKKGGAALAGIAIFLFAGAFLSAALFIYILNTLLQKIFSINSYESYKLSLNFTAVFFLFLLFPLVRVVFSTQLGFNQFLEIYSAPLFYWRTAFLACLFTIIAAVTTFPSSDVFMKNNENKVSIFLLMLCFFFGVVFFFNNTICGDGAQYYAWLHSLVIDHDLKFENEIAYMIPAEFADGVIGVIPTRLGVCVAWFPLYALTHLAMVVLHVLRITRLEANGWSELYMASVFLTSLLASFAGLVLCYKVLRRYFTYLASFLAVAMVYLGSAIFTWTFVHPTYNHAVDFFITVLFIYYWSFTWGHRDLWQWRILGLIFFSTVLVREQNILFGVLLVFEAIMDYRGRDRGKFKFLEFARGYLNFLCVFIAGMVILALLAIRGGFINNLLFAARVAKDNSFVGLQTILTLLFYPTTGIFSATPITAFSFAGIILMVCYCKKYPAKLILITISIFLVFLLEFGVLALSYSPRLFHFNIGARYFINVSLFFMLGLGFLFDSIVKYKLSGLFVKAMAWCAVIYYLMLNVQYQAFTYLTEWSSLKQILKQLGLSYMFIPEVLTKYIFWSRPKMVSNFVEINTYKLFYCFFVIVLFVLCAFIFNKILLPNQSKRK